MTMVTIEINNSFSKILNLNAIQEKQLKSKLSYTVGGASSYYSGFGQRKKSLIDKYCVFPTGLLQRVLIFLSTSKITYELLDFRVKPKSIALCKIPLISGVTPYEAQLSAVESALHYNRGILSMPTGSGKSLVIALIASKLSVKTLIVVPSLEIKKQLTEALNNLKVLNAVVENIDSKNLQKMTDFDCLIIDEAHHVAAKTYQKLNKTAWNKIYYRFFLTATPFRNDMEEMLLFESIAGQVIFQLSYKEAVEAKYIVPVESYYIEIPKQETDAYTWAQVYSNVVVNNTKRNIILSSLLLKLQLSHKSTLCLVKEVAHGKILADLTGLPFISGADEQSRDYIRQFNSGEIKVLLGTEGILSEGIDTKPCEYVIIAGLGKAKSAFMQKVGRGVRRYTNKESCKVIIVKDKSHKFCIKHFNEQCKILNTEYGSKPLKLEFP